MRPAHVVAPGLVLTAANAALPLPRRIRAGAGLALGGYAAVLVVSATRIAASARPDLRDAAALPLVLATMHLSWGVGYLMGCWRFGPPLQGLWNLRRRVRVVASP